MNSNRNTVKYYEFKESIDNFVDFTLFILFFIHYIFSTIKWVTIKYKIITFEPMLSIILILCIPIGLRIISYFSVKEPIIRSLCNLIYSIALEITTWVMEFIEFTEFSIMIIFGIFWVLWLIIQLISHLFS